jgi:hypothetical protein
MDEEGLITSTVISTDDPAQLDRVRVKSIASDWLYTPEGDRLQCGDVAVLLPIAHQENQYIAVSKEYFDNLIIQSTWTK